MNSLDTIIFGNGCFWCTEAIFQDLRGVESVESGYSGGHVENPSYEQVCSKTTGHAEVVKITYDPSVISRDQILDIFFVTHDPTTLNRQGNDVGPQYRSAIFYKNEEEKAAAEAAKIKAGPLYDNPIVTEVSPLINYYPAEGYHQNYFNQHGNQPYCAFVIRPKVAKFRKQYLDMLKK
ncbi:MAG: peptide-methionine (S)-S-oxide reductase MsrA [Bacteroidia bacterium]|nr:peptide-methionine (S)-S-oxide reductase MsrA [Bacteroidia bacterium]